MIRLDMEQGSPEWHAARLGIPTASAFSRIISPKTMRLSESSQGYLYELLAERMLGIALESASSDFMVRGRALEDSAIAYYELQRGVDTDKIGFALTDDRRVGCSPDRLVGTDGGLEIKCPSPAVHVGHLLDGLPTKFQPQVQGCLWITGRVWWDLLSFHPDLTPALVRVCRDEDYIAALSNAVAGFCERLEKADGKLSIAAEGR